jgi:hypothetical protein
MLLKESVDANGQRSEFEARILYPLHCAHSNEGSVKMKAQWIRNKVGTTCLGQFSGNYAVRNVV